MVMHRFLNRSDILPPITFLAARLILILSLPYESVNGYGDFPHFFHMAGMGKPFIDFWIEFPPLFPFLSRGIYLLAGGSEHVYQYLLVLIFTLVQAAGIWVFIRIGCRIFPPQLAVRRSWVYLALLVPLFYGWTYFDPLAVLAMLLGLYWLMEGKDWSAGLALAAGTLVKLFPALTLIVAWKVRPLPRAARITLLTIGITIGVYAVLYIAAPQMTLASIRAQPNKGSWETLWALLDKNLSTGNFGPEIERFDPRNASVPIGNPAQIPSWLTLIPLAIIGAWVFWKSRVKTDRAMVALLGITWVIFTLWSPGWSPQWVLYFLPLILLSLPEKKGYLTAVIFVLVNLLEWPVLLSRGYNWGLWITVLLRMVILIMMGVEFWKLILPANPVIEEDNSWTIHADLSS